MTTGGSASIECESLSLGEVIAEIRRQLLAVGIESAEQEAAWLVQGALSLSPLQQAVNRKRPLTRKEAAEVATRVAKRLKREPLQYILGTQEFCGLEFTVNPSVLIPRPETELLISETIRRLPKLEESPVLIDVGTGTGCLAVTLARTMARSNVFAIDISCSALEMARQNARRHDVERAITWLEGDLLMPLSGRGLEGTVSAIISNPPYIRESQWPMLQPEVRMYEPPAALIAGPRGIELHERLLREAVSYLAPGGLLVMEMGQGQSAELAETVESMAAYRSVDVVPDEAGIDRVLIAERAG